MAGDSKTFTFELQESLFFEKGQEVAEMKGIALDPEISIQPYDEYISIRGMIELHGEYERVISNVQEEKLIDFDDYQAKRYVENVIEENGLTTFSHRFPVEISVPPYRVANLDDITVNIESFDYELPESSQLKLYATVEINGINSEAEKQREEVEEAIEGVLEEFVNNEESTFEFEIKKQKEEVERQEDIEVAEREVIEELTETNQSEAIDETIVTEETVELGEVEEERRSQSENPVELGEVEEVHPQVENPVESGVVEEERRSQAEDQIEPNEMKEDSYTEVEDPDRWKIKSQTLTEFFNQLPGDNNEVSNSYAVGSAQVTGETEETTESEVADYEQQTVEDATYLSDIFRDKEEESFTKMRICIVQDQDTIETIAQRFSISPLQLIKQNELEADFEVQEGQLLYIPANK
ncbi:stage VI sporulation protein D [Oceanobacillus rekensis]|uniref:stage VI sporulation protein D n=1 Tax=Oceanobacillus rekensis TaxID=937927 RepID=UPI000B44C3A6|nr:stage VI sporulation protein D [Oceanobacillus rekensis]